MLVVPNGRPMTKSAAKGPIMLTQDTPIYRDIPNFPGYRIALFDDRVEVQTSMRCERKKTGRGFSWAPSDHWRPLNHNINNYGYHVVTLCRDKRTHCRLVHRLVLEMLVGPRPVEMQCRHLNGVRTDNRPSNLTWGTGKENERDKIAHGTSSHGERNPSAKLTYSLVETIKRRIDNGDVQADLAREYGVGNSTISRIKHGKSWSKQV